MSLDHDNAGENGSAEPADNMEENLDVPLFKDFDERKLPEGLVGKKARELLNELKTVLRKKSVQTR